MMTLRHSDKKEYFGLRGPSLHRAVAALAGMGFLLFGYDQGVMGGFLTLPSFLDRFPKMNDSNIQGAVVSIYEIGCMFGALFTMYAGDKYGRRKMIFFGAIIMIIGAILQTTAFNIVHLAIARVITGIGNGINTATVPTWQSECAKPEDRGHLVMLQGSLISGGIMISYWLDLGFYFAPGQLQWRFPLGFQIFFALFLVMFVLSLPESPRWLIKQDRIQEAKEIFASLDDTTPEDALVIAQVEEVLATIIMEEHSSSGARKIFTMGKKRHFHRAMLGFWNQAAQQLTGINLITYYAAFLYQDSIKMGYINSRILAAANGTEYFMASWIAYYTIERIGRRKLMLFGSAGQSFTMAILTGTVYAAQDLHNTKAGIAAAVFLFVFNTFFAIGWLGMTWLYPAEIVSLEVRAPVNGLSTAGNWIFNFMVVMVTPVAFKNIKYYTYTVFAALNAVIFVATFIFYPETAGRSLEEIDQIFEASNPKTPWDVVHIAETLPHKNARIGGLEVSDDVKARVLSSHVETA